MVEACINYLKIAHISHICAQFCKTYQSKCLDRSLKCILFVLFCINDRLKFFFSFEFRRPISVLVPILTGITSWRTRRRNRVGIALRRQALRQPGRILLGLVDDEAQVQVECLLALLLEATLLLVLNNLEINPKIVESITSIWMAYILKETFLMLDLQLILMRFSSRRPCCLYSTT